MMSAKKLSLTQKLFSKILVDHVTGCWNFNGVITSDGYGQLWHEGRARRAHRAVYEHYFGAIEEGGLACHKCDNRRCVNPHHIYIGTAADNNRDVRERGQPGKAKRGVEHHNAKLCPDDVLKIRGGGQPQRQLAREFGVSQTTVSEIQRGLIWGHL